MMLRRVSVIAVLSLLLIYFIGSVASTPEEGYELYEKTSYAWQDPADEDGINLCYRSILLAQMDLSLADPELQSLALDYFHEILSRQTGSGEIMRYRDGGTVNSKLMTGLGAWALSLAYAYTGDDAYAEAARLAADYLIVEMDEWEDTYPSECDDPRCELARNGGDNSSALTSYCWTSPNDLGLVALGIGAVVYYGAGGDEYYDYCCKLADALYDMQLADGSWYDGYAYTIPSRWDRSTHYVTMAMMGTWMAYKITGDDRYSDSLSASWEWLVDMQISSGAVYDIWVDDENLQKAPENDDNRYDFLQVDGDTNVKDYYNYAFKTFLGEFSFILSGSFMNNVGLESDGYEVTKQYLDERMAISNWYLLSLTLETEEQILPYWAVGYDGIGSALCSLGDDEGSSSGDVLNWWPMMAAVLIAAMVYMFLRRRGNEN